VAHPGLGAEDAERAAAVERGEGAADRGSEGRELEGRGAGGVPDLPEGGTLSPYGDSGLDKLLHNPADGASIDRQFGHHTLRRSGARFTAEADPDSISTLVDVLGHEDEAHTMRYCGLTIDGLATINATVSERLDRTRARMKVAGEIPKPPSIRIVIGPENLGIFRAGQIGEVCPYPAEPTYTYWHIPALPLSDLLKRLPGCPRGFSGVARLPVHAPLLLIINQSPFVEKISLHDLIGLENIRPLEAVCLVLFVAIPTIWVGLVNTSALGYTFMTFAGSAYMIAVFRSASRRDDYNEP